MKVILHSVLKRKTINSIKELGQGICEIMIDIDLSFATCNSVEYVKSEEKIWIHVFEEDYDLVVDFDDLEEMDKIEIFRVLKAI